MTRLLIWLAVVVCGPGTMAELGSGQTAPETPCGDAPAAMVAPMGMAAAGNGAVLIIDRGRRAVLRVDVADGDCVVVSSADNGTGPAFNAPVGIITAGQQMYYVVDPGAGGVFEIDPRTATAIRSPERRMAPAPNSRPYAQSPALPTAASLFSISDRKQSWASIRLPATGRFFHPVR